MTMIPRIALLAALLSISLVGAAQLRFEAGKHYVALEIPQPVEGEGVEVLEFFSYGCPHCYHFEPHLTDWLIDKPEHVNFRRVPTGLGQPFFQQMSAAFHIAHELGVGAEIHAPLFAEIHEERNRQIASMAGLQAFFAEHGVAPEEFVAAVNSEAVRERFASVEAMAPRYGVMGVPTIVVNGRYRVSVGEHVRSWEEMLEIVDFLVEQES